MATWARAVCTVHPRSAAAGSSCAGAGARLRLRLAGDSGAALRSWMLFRAYASRTAVLVVPESARTRQPTSGGVTQAQGEWALAASLRLRESGHCQWPGALCTACQCTAHWQCPAGASTARLGDCNATALGRSESPAPALGLLAWSVSASVGRSSPTRRVRAHVEPAALPLRARSTT